MKVRWEIDEYTVVSADFGFFGQRTVSVNGQRVVRKFGGPGRFQTDFTLADGRQAHLVMRPRSLAAPFVDLRIGERRFVRTPQQTPKCAGCAAAIKTYDRFCQHCGQATPTAEAIECRDNVASTTKSIKSLAYVLLAFGLLAFLSRWGQSFDALAKMAELDPATLLQVGGRELTVAELRARLSGAIWGVLITNLTLAAVMAGLANWSKRSPLPATLVAAAVFVVVQVGSALNDLATIGGGLIVRIAVVVLLARAIRSALAARSMAA